MSWCSTSIPYLGIRTQNHSPFILSSWSSGWFVLLNTPLLSLYPPSLWWWTCSGYMNITWNLSQHRRRRWTLKPLSVHEYIYFLDAIILANNNNILELIFPVCSNDKLQWNIGTKPKKPAAWESVGRLIANVRMRVRFIMEFYWFRPWLRPSNHQWRLLGTLAQSTEEINKIRTVEENAVQHNMCRSTTL